MGHTEWDTCPSQGLILVTHSHAHSYTPRGQMHGFGRWKEIHTSTESGWEAPYTQYPEFKYQNWFFRAIVWKAIFRPSSSRDLLRGAMHSEAPWELHTFKDLTFLTQTLISVFPPLAHAWMLRTELEQTEKTAKMMNRQCVHAFLS